MLHQGVDSALKVASEESKRLGIAVGQHSSEQTKKISDQQGVVLASYTLQQLLRR